MPDSSESAGSSAASPTRGQTPPHAPPTLADGALLAVFGTLGPFAANTYVPAFGEIAKDFGVGIVAVQQSLSLYLVTFAVVSLFIGALSDALGRRRVLVAATLGFAAASLGAMTAESIAAFYGWRFLMGLTVSAGPVLSQAIVRDRWQGIEAAKIIALIAVLFGLGPCLAPIVGGELTVHFGWRSIFAFLALFSLGLTALSLFVLKESLPPERRVSFRPAETVRRYCRVLACPPFTAGVLAHGCCFMGLIVYSAGAADFVLHVMGLGIDEFAWMMVPIVAVSMAGTWIGPKLLEKMGARHLVFGGFALLIGSGLVGALVEWVEPLGFPWVLLAPLVYNFAAGAVRPTINVMNLDYFPKSRGLAASVQQFCLTGAFAVSSALLVPLVMGAAWKYSLVMLFSGLAALALWLVVDRTRAKHLPAGAGRF